ncbi:hypothetical protein [Bradyrhizobium sp.]|jgi:hypothetical protein|uniref:hypothetical protein n=1 Tax=Bradyrhizobium sp. TaxID=376 RepID=UPI002D6482F9|nr:hypothetical protein [Bradyrhizobium sp.]HZR73704.1 hypothetical protein [Bradyrhizobium sp.]
MLPGFRFLFAAIMLSLSLLIFGLGAAALFRAAHESFASNSTWRATPDVPFAQRPETTLPVLATLRVERMTEKAPDTAKVAVAPAEPAPAISEPMTSDQVAALQPAEAPVTEIAKPVTAKEEIAKPADTPAPAPVAENPPAPEVAPAAPAAADVATSSETKTAALAASDAAMVRSEPAPAQAEPIAAAPTAPAPDKAEPVTSAAEASPPATTTPAATTETSDAMTKIATLGGPPVEITDTESVPEARLVKLPRARPDESVIKKRQQARRALHRRRLAAARARLLAQQQLQANPFTQQTFAQQPQQSFATSAPR